MTVQQWSDWLGVSEMALILGMSDATMKRRIQQWVKDGLPIKLTDGRSVEIQAEQVLRPQGHEWRVRVNAAHIDLSGVPELPDSKEAPPISSAQMTASSDDHTAVSTLRDMVVMERAERQRLANDLRAESVARAAAETRASMLQAERDDLAARLLAAEAARDAERAEVERLTQEAARRRFRWWPW